MKGTARRRCACCNAADRLDAAETLLCRGRRLFSRFSARRRSSSIQKPRAPDRIRRRRSGEVEFRVGSSHVTHAKARVGRRPGSRRRRPVVAPATIVFAQRGGGPRPMCRAGRSARCAGAASARRAAAGRSRSPAARRGRTSTTWARPAAACGRRPTAASRGSPVTDGQINYSSIGAVAVAPSNPDVVYIGTGESEHPRQHHPGRRRVQVDRRRQDVDAHRPRPTRRSSRRSASTRPTRISSTSPPSAITPRRIRIAACSDRRTAARRGTRFSSATTRPARTSSIIDPEQSAGDLRRAVGGVSQFVADVVAAGRAAGSSSRPTAAIAGPRSRATPGLPKAMLGKIGLSVSGADSNRVYAQIEADDGGFFVSDDAGATWTKVTRSPRPAPARVLLHARLRRSEGEGHRLRAERRLPQVDRRRQDVEDASRSPHGDNHDLWIAPNDSNRDGRGERRRRHRVGERRRDVDAGDDADGAVLPRDHDQARPVSRLRRAAGQQHGMRLEPAAAGRSGGSAAASIRCSTRSAAARAATSPAIRATPTSSTPAATAA